MTQAQVRFLLEHPALGWQTCFHANRWDCNIPCAMAPPWPNRGVCRCFFDAEGKLGKGGRQRHAARRATLDNTPAALEGGKCMIRLNPPIVVRWWPYGPALVESTLNTPAAGCAPPRAGYKQPFLEPGRHGLFSPARPLASTITADQPAALQSADLLIDFTRPEGRWPIWLPAAPRWR